MLIATWNLNHRAGKRRPRLEAVNAIATLQPHVVVLTEYCPQGRHDEFCATLSVAGWPYAIASETDGEIANRVLIASRSPLESAPVALPTFDRQFPPNILAVKTAGLRFLGVRIPAYDAKEDRHCLLASWDWLETTMSCLHDAPTIVLGDLNSNPTSSAARGGEHFRRILADGWRRATPTGGASYFGHSGRRSEIDHMLCNGGRGFIDSRYVIEARGWRLAGGEGALSDHAALLADILND